LTFQHKNAFIVFTFNTQVETWHSNGKKNIDSIGRPCFCVYVVYASVAEFAQSVAEFAQSQSSLSQALSQALPDVITRASERVNLYDELAGSHLTKATVSLRFYSLKQKYCWPAHARFWRGKLVRG